MGIEEQLLELATRKGEVRGRATAEASKELSFVRSLVKNTDFDNEKIATLAAVSIAFVKKVRSKLRLNEAAGAS